MASSSWWDSLERMERSFRVARGCAIGGLGLSIVAWGLWLVIIAVPATVFTATAILFTLFTWFRKDDLQRGAPRR
jgi:hypothetical protein